MPTLTRDATRSEIIERLWEKAMGNIFEKEPNLCCTSTDVNVLADIDVNDGRQEIVECPTCEERWVRHVE